jgi:hypothetical protein
MITRFISEACHHRHRKNRENEISNEIQMPRRIRSATYNCDSVGRFVKAPDEIDVIRLDCRYLQGEDRHRIHCIQYIKHRQICKGARWD